MPVRLVIVERTTRARTGSRPRPIVGFKPGVLDRVDPCREFRRGGECEVRIEKLAGGRIVQTGSYAELMAQKGLFAEFAARQLV